MDQLTKHASTANLQQSSHAFARYLDAHDSSASLRDQFLIPTNNANEESIYLAANLTGLQPKRTKALVNQELDVWGSKGFSGVFNHPYDRPWIKSDLLVLDDMCALVGAKNASEIAIMGSVSTNMHLLFVPFYRPTKDRFKVLVESHAFCTCLYAIESQIKYHGFDPKDALVTVHPAQHTITVADIESVLKEHGDQICMCLFPGVQYYTGQLFDMQKIAALGRKYGVVVGWDLAHAVGNVEIHAHDWELDFAVWCSYKYLNAGPGGIAGLYVHEKHNADLVEKYPKFAGWWGNDESTRFLMQEQYVSSPGALGLQLSCPSMLTVVCLLASLQVFHMTTMTDLRARSVRMTAYLEYLLNEYVMGSEVELITPSDPDQRGAQLSLLFPMLDSVKPLAGLLESHNVVVGMRNPNVICVAPSPLFNTYSEIRTFVDILVLCLRALADQK